MGCSYQHHGNIRRGATQGLQTATKGRNVEMGVISILLHLGWAVTHYAASTVATSAVPVPVLTMPCRSPSYCPSHSSYSKLALVLGLPSIKLQLSQPQPTDQGPLKRFSAQALFLNNLTLANAASSCPITTLAPAIVLKIISATRLSFLRERYPDTKHSQFWL